MTLFAFIITYVKFQLILLSATLLLLNELSITIVIPVSSLRDGQECFCKLIQRQIRETGQHAFRNCLCRNKSFFD